MEYTTAVEFSYNQLLQALANANNHTLELIDKKTNTDLGKLLGKIDSSFVHDIVITPVQSNSTHTMFFCNIDLGEIGSIYIKTDWSVWQPANLQQMVSNLLKPIWDAGLRHRVSFKFQDVKINPLEDETKIIEQLVSYARLQNNEQFNFAYGEICNCTIKQCANMLKLAA